MGVSFLQLSLSNDEFIVAPNQATISRLDIINLATLMPTTMPPESPRKETTIDNHDAKIRKNEAKLYIISLDSTNIRTKETIPNINIVSHMWLRFSIHEVVASQRGTKIIHEHRTNEDFAKIGTPSREIIDFKTFRRAFPQVPQMFYPNERPYAVPDNHLHFIQLPRQENVSDTTGLSEGFYIFILITASKA